MGLHYDNGSNRILTTDGQAGLDMFYSDLVRIRSGGREMLVLDSATGEVGISGQYTLPGTRGNDGDVLVLGPGGSGAVWQAPSPSGITSIVEDSAPTLGGDLNTNNFNIGNATGFLSISAANGLNLGGIAGGNQVYIDNSAKLWTFDVDVSGNLISNTIATRTYSLPTTSGNPGDVIVLKADGFETEWQAPSGGGGGLTAAEAIHLSLVFGG